MEAVHSTCKRRLCIVLTATAIARRPRLLLAVKGEVSGAEIHDDGKTYCAALGEAGVAVMPIVPLLAQSAFDPEFIETLVAAFEDAWATVETSGSKFASPRYRRAAQEIIAKRIIEMAQRGERERSQLAEDAVSFLDRSYA
jgi:CO/xanthine dehydrogenase FAD-binding subunit